MADGTNVGAVYLDLIVRDTVDKQVQAIAAKAQAQAQQAFSGVEKIVNSTSSAGKQVGEAFNKSVAMAHVKVKELETQLERVTAKLNRAKYEDNDTATKRLLEQQTVLYDKLEAARERLAIQIRASAEKQAAAEIAAAQKTARATEVASAKRQVVATQAHTAADPPPAPVVQNTVESAHPTFWQRLTAIVGRFQTAATQAFSSANNAGAALNRTISGAGKRFTTMGRAAGHFGSRLKEIAAGALLFNGISAVLRGITTYLGNAISSSDQMKTALANLKGAAATAAAPIIQVLTPALTALTNTIATALSYFSRLISFFTGTSVSAMANAAKGMQKTANVAKKTMASLAGFDEIQRLDGGGQGSGEESNQGFDYEFQGQNPVWDKLIEPLKKIDFTAAAVAFKHLEESVSSLGTVVLDSLEWAWFNILVPLSQWTIEETVPGILELLASAFDAVTAALAPALKGVQDLLTWIDPVFSFVGDVAVVALDELGSIFEKVAGVFEDKGTKVQGIISGIGEILAAVWAQIEPMLQNWMGVFDATFQYIGDVLGVWISLAVDILYGLVEFLAGAFTGDWDRAWDGISGIISGVKDTIEKLVSALTTFLGTAWDVIAQNAVIAFNLFKDTMLNIWNGIMSGIKGSINSIIGFVNGLMSGICEGINTVIRAMNKLKWDIPDWVPVLGGKSFGFNLSTISAPKIPMLADGGVITQPTLAMMGEYAGARNNPEIVTPQSVMAETVATVMEDHIQAMMAGFEALLEENRELRRTVEEIEVGDETIWKAYNRFERQMAVVRGG